MREFWKILNYDKYRIMNGDHTIGILKKGTDLSEIIKLGDYEEITQYIMVDLESDILMNPRTTEGHYYRKTIIEQALKMLEDDCLEIERVLFPKKAYPILIETTDNETMVVAPCFNEGDWVGKSKYVRGQRSNLYMRVK